MNGIGFSQNRNDNFLYLNRDNRWLDFQCRGLELRKDGALQLYSLPLLDGELPEELDTFNDPDGPAGLAIDVDGTIYFSDPTGCRVLKVDACDGTIATVPCIGGKGREPAQLNIPRGLLIPSYRPSLFVADSLNHRIQIFDLASGQVVAIWGQPSLPGEQQSSSPAGRLINPWALAGDDSGNVYILDYGNQSLQKFNRAGEIVSAFWETLAQTAILTRPSDIAAYSQPESVQLFVVDETSHSVFLLDQDGKSALDQGHPVSIGATQLQKPMGIAVSKVAVYVGDNALHRVLKFKNGGGYEFIGEAVGYRGPVAALALDGRGNLLVHTGSSLAPIRLAIDKGSRRAGVLWSRRPLKAAEFKVKWHRVQATTEQLATGAHLRLFVHTSDNETDAPSIDPESDAPFADPKWTPAAVTPDPLSDVDDLFIGGEPGRFLWIGAHFVGDGRSTPIMSQMRVEFDHASYLDYLPAIYRKEAEPTGFLLRFLSLFETFFGDLENRIGSLAKLFDPEAAPQSFLPWLASWLALELDENWDEEKQRRAIASAFRMYGRRGTVEGLRESLRTFAGVNAIIEEPIQNAAWWSLPAGTVCCECDAARQVSKEQSWQATENSILGVTTMLAAAQPQGAVVGTTATLDHSHLITNEEFGAPLFEDVAHQFSVQLYQSQLRCAETLSKVRAVLDREKPAHTVYHLCIVEPRLRVGFQARVGIDAVVSGPPMQTKLDEPLTVGNETVLAGQPAGRIGEESRVGITTRVG